MAPSTAEPARRKCVILGRGSCGKRTLSYVLLRGPKVIPFIQYHASYETLLADLELPDGRAVEMSLYYLWNHEGYDHLRYILYLKAGVVVATFAVDDLESFEDVKDKWIPEARSYIKDVPILLVGCKGDLRTSPDSHLRCFVPVSEAEGLAATLGLLGYAECSAYDWDSVKDVFKLAATASLPHRKGESTTCTIS